MHTDRNDCDTGITYPVDVKRRFLIFYNEKGDIFFFYKAIFLPIIVIITIDNLSILIQYAGLASLWTIQKAES